MSKRIRICFYKAKWWDGHWLDNAISLWTWLISRKNRKVGPYSHVEIWTPDDDPRNISSDKFKSFIPRGNPQFAHSEPPLKQDIAGTCWTSTMRGKDNGTVKRAASTVIENDKRWDVCEIEVDPLDHETGLAYMHSEVAHNKGYSFKDTGKFFGLGIIADKLRNICSEFCNNYCVKAKILMGWGVVSPRRLAWKLVQAGYEIKPLKEIT